jgi:hypothetical protein
MDLVFDKVSYLPDGDVTGIAPESGTLTISHLGTPLSTVPCHGRLTWGRSPKADTRCPGPMEHKHFPHRSRFCLIHGNDSVTDSLPNLTTRSSLKITKTGQKTPPYCHSIL